ncbi:AI-2E family transporter [Humibacter ginsenosidimutans]|uniref:AI-2E family transporter n=1 Tax=Humibacter ginsenosidimutans TaxID=2599293 RepID=A0A5B8M1X6_9MICO|nr:AI-2E family transporter [Humibacter ginsenosidimutans]QDZ14266.1 AI-2E family transporter [Humibacter ginsenosidimutans]
MAWWRRQKSDATVPEEAPDDGADAGTVSSLPRADAILLGLAGATVTALGMFWIRGFLAPVLLALVLTVCVHPLRRALERWGVNRGVATGSVIAAVFVLLAAFVAALVVALAQFASLLPQFAPQLEQAGKTIGSWLHAIGFDQAQVQAFVSDFDPTRLIGAVGGLLGSVANITFGLVVILTCLILMAVDASALGAISKQVAAHRPHLVTALSGFAVGVRRYMVVTTGLGVAQGLLNWVALLILQVPGAFLWGMLSFLCSFIPNIGYFIAIIPPLVFGLLTGGWPVFIAVILVYGVINSVVQSIIQPRIVGNAVALSQTITFVSVLFWAVVIGPIGAILAVPLTLLARTILIDSDPRARWWRPIIGDLRDTKPYLDEEKAEYEKSRRDAKAAKRGDAVRPPTGAGTDA